MMGKVVTSEGMAEFVTTGKTAEMPPAAAPPTESPPPPQPAADEPPSSAVAPVEAAAGEAQKDEIKELGLEREFTPEELKTIGHKVQRSMATRHRRMKEAQESQAEAEQWARDQWREKVEVERERDALRQQLEQTARQAQPAPQAKAEPKIQDFMLPDGQTDWVTFVDKRSEWRAEQAVLADRRQREEAEKARQEEARQAALRAQDDQTRARFQEARARYPDFEQAMEASKSILLQHSVLQYLREAEVGPDVTYHLIKHPEEVKRIQKLSPVLAVAEVAKLAAQFPGESSASLAHSGTGKSPEAEKNTGANVPPPITPLQASGAGSVVADPSKMSFKELRDYERQRQKKR